MMKGIVRQVKKTDRVQAYPMVRVFWLNGFGVLHGSESSHDGRSLVSAEGEI